ncbi:MAG: cobaltochelatase CobS [Bacteroidia bacterium]|jgi:cobaltochelatase CobS
MTNLTTLNTAPAINYNQLEEVCGSTLFPALYQPGEVKLKRRAHRHPDCIMSNPDYIPDETLLRRSLAWFFFPSMKPLGLHGETGTGKTELALYICDMLNEPLYIVKVHPALMPEDIEGCKDLIASEKGVVSKNSLGLAAKAYRNGGVLLLDEVDKVNAPLGCALHGLTDGKPWPIEQFNIVINKHPYFRCMATANTMGEGGHERYHTSNRMDQALRSRFGWRQTHFPDSVHELKILEKKFPMLPYGMKKEMVSLANAMRDALLGKDRKGNIDNPINAVFSTRTLVDWGKATLCFGKTAIWRESLDYAFQGSIDPEHLDSVNDIIHQKLHGIIDKTVKEVVEEYTTVKK